MCFGYGEVVCPDCYDNEQPFLLLDDSYWLNRLLMRFRRDNVERTVRVEEEAAIEEVMVDEPLMELVPQH